MKEVVIGTEFTSSTLVINSNTAIKVGSGEAPVFSTPMMIALMENAAYLCLKPFLDDEETSVGISMNVSHESATPIGMAVTAIAKILSVEGKVVTFSVTASDAFGVIGRGEHKRAVVNSQKFIERANKKQSIL